MDLGIRGRTAIVCAASRGLGRAIAIALAREGVNLVVNARSEAALAALAGDLRRETGVSVTAVAADVKTDEGRRAVQPTTSSARSMTGSTSICRAIFRSPSSPIRPG